MTKLQTQNVAELKKITMWQNSKTQIVNKLKNSKFEKTYKKKIKILQNSKTHIVRNKPKHSNWDKTMLYLLY